jgi:hypothetical protein
VSHAVKSPSRSDEVIHASRARADVLYAVMVSSWNGRFSWLVRDRSHWQNSLIIIARNCSPVIEPEAED